MANETITFPSTDTPTIPIDQNTKLFAADDSGNPSVVMGGDILSAASQNIIGTITAASQAAPTTRPDGTALQGGEGMRLGVDIITAAQSADVTLTGFGGAVVPEGTQGGTMSYDKASNTWSLAPGALSTTGLQKTATLLTDGVAAGLAESGGSDKTVKQLDDNMLPVIKIPGKNLYNAATVTANSYLLSDGTLGASPNYQVSDYMPVIANQSYRKGYMSNPSRNVAFYDSNKVFLSFVAAGAPQAGMPTSNDIMTPTNCAYVRMDMANADVAGAQFEKGTTTTSYEPYITSNSLVASNIDGLDDAVGPILEESLQLYPTKSYLLTPKKNLFDKTAATQGFYPSATTGQLVVSVTLAASDYMSVTPGLNYYDPLGSQIAFYDSNKNYISGIAGAGTTATYLIPSGIAFIRVTVRISGLDTYQFEQGIAPTSYEAYTLILKSSLLPVPANAYWAQKVLTPLVNLHTDLHPLVQTFMNKLGQQDVVSYKPVVLVAFGDSLMAYISTSTIGSIDVTTSFPCATSANNLFATIWQQLKQFLPDYRRWDNTLNTFTEAGTWASYISRNVDATWDDNTDREGDTRYSNTANASVSFAVPSSCRMANFIDRTTPTGRNVTVAITQGNGYMEVLQNNDFTANVWVEANGYIFSQSQTANSGSQIGNTEYQRRIYFRKTTAQATAAPTITFTADGTTGYFCYWGMELVTRNSYLQIYNAARGAHTIQLITPYLQTDVWGKNPDFIFWEVPMCNNLNTPTMAYSLQPIQDILFGDRSGATNTYNMSNKTSGFTTCQVVAYMPNFRQSYYNSNGSYAIATSPYTYRDIYDKCIAYMRSRNISVVDMERVYQQEIAVNPDFNGQMYLGMAAGGLSGYQYTSDGTHPNDNAVKIWREHDLIFN